MDLCLGDVPVVVDTWADSEDDGVILFILLGVWLLTGGMCDLLRCSYWVENCVGEYGDDVGWGLILWGVKGRICCWGVRVANGVAPASFLGRCRYATRVGLPGSS